MPPYIPWFKFYPADFMNGVRGLSATEIGLYIMLLSRIYEESGPVELNVLRLATYCGISFLEADDWTDFRAYIRHVHFDLRSFRDPKDLIPAWLGHYRVKQGVYDVDRATTDLATFPPIAARIAELKAEKG